MAKLFGTDGIRGIVNEKLTAQLAFNLGKAYAIVLQNTAKYKKILVGRDTRISGQMLCSAFVAGLNSMGFSAILPNVLPTPAHSFLTRTLEVDGGVMLTASHNPPEHNGIKFCDENGNKLSKEIQEEIERVAFNIDSYLGCEPMQVGGFEQNEDLLANWVNHVVETLDLPNFEGLKIALDTANGAGSAVIPYVYKMLGAKVIAFNNEGDGSKINRDCGSLHLDKFIAECVANDVFLGFSFDGDADRVMVIDGKGNIIDGTDLMYIFANYLNKKGELKGNVISTIVTNCGLENSLEKLGIKLTRTQVGGQYIQREMLATGANLGGEENGHIMLGQVGTESDGMSVSLFLLKILLETKEPLQQLLAGLIRTKVVNSDVRVSERQKQEVESGVLTDFVDELENSLNNSGRIVVRTSGTESLVRVLVEGEDEAELKRINDLIVQKINEL